MNAYSYSHHERNNIPSTLLPAMFHLSHGCDWTPHPFYRPTRRASRRK